MQVVLHGACFALHAIMAVPDFREHESDISLSLDIVGIFLSTMAAR